MAYALSLHPWGHDMAKEHLDNQNYTIRASGSRPGLAKIAPQEVYASTHKEAKQRADRLKDQGYADITIEQNKQGKPSSEHWLWK